MVLDVLVVHEHRVYAEALQSIIDSQEDLRCVGLATATDVALQVDRVEQPDVVLIDLEMASATSLTAQELEAIVVAMASEPTMASYGRAQELGATGLVAKAAPIAEVLSTVRAASLRMTVCGVTLDLLLTDARGWIDLRDQHEVDLHLTARERQALRFMLEGLDAKRMARAMHVSVHTARSHIKKVLRKLGAHSQLEAVAIATRLGLSDRESPGQ